MKKVKRIDSANIPVFSAENFFRKDESVYIHVSTSFPEFVGIVHKHEFIEIVYILSGTAMHVVGNHQYSVSKGDLCIVNYETPHAFITDTDESFVAYDLMFTLDFFDSSLFSNNFESIGSSYLFYSLFPDEQPFHPDLQLIGASFSMIGDIFNKIYTEYYAQEKGYIDIIRAYVIELIVKVFRQIDSSGRVKIAPWQEKIVDAALCSLHKNYNTHITTKVLAANAFLNRNYFGKLFRDVTGKPVWEFLREIRIEEACKLLRSENTKILDVALQCGFDDIKNFYTVFKKLMGVTPGEYRKNVSFIRPL